MTRTAAVVDVGSNTVRLVVARCGPDGIRTTHTERVRLRLSREIEQNGCITDASVAATAEAVREMCDRARAWRASFLDVLVTAPGRQAENGSDLAAAIERAVGQAPRILTPEEEARLAFAGAVALARPDSRPKPVAVVDLGGASTEIAIGHPATGPVWLRSVDLGAARLTEGLLPGKRRRRAHVDGARSAIAEAFADVEAPRPGTAFVVGGSARALGRILGPILGAGELQTADLLLPLCRPAELSRRFGVSRGRARLLLAAALVLAEVQRKLAVPLEVSAWGIREGALLAAGRQTAAG